jgi:hypothetical protein
MKRNALAAAALVLGAGLVGCTPSLVDRLADRSYSAARDGAQKALSLTFSVAAVVTNWLPEMPETKCPHCPHSQEPPAAEDAAEPDVAI